MIIKTQHSIGDKIIFNNQDYGRLKGEISTILTESTKTNNIVSYKVETDGIKSNKTHYIDDSEIIQKLNR